jgi:hypothetical protein
MLSAIRRPTILCALSTELLTQGNSFRTPSRHARKPKSWWAGTRSAQQSPTSSRYPGKRHSDSETRCQRTLPVMAPRWQFSATPPTASGAIDRAQPVVRLPGDRPVQRCRKGMLPRQRRSGTPPLRGVWNGRPGSANSSLGASTADWPTPRAGSPRSKALRREYCPNRGTSTRKPQERASATAP